MSRLSGGIRSDVQESVASIDGDQVVEAVLGFGEGDNPAPACAVRVTWNRGYRTPVIAVYAPHPGIRLDVYDYKGRKIFSTLPRGGDQSQAGDGQEVV